MRLLFSGAIACSELTMKRLHLLADEIGFIARIGSVVALGETDHEEFEPTPVEVEVNKQKLQISSFGLQPRYDGSIPFTYYVPPEDPISNDLYLHYLIADLQSSEFRTTILSGLARSESFAYKLLNPFAGIPSFNLADETQTPIPIDSQVCNILYSHQELIGASLPSPRPEGEPFNVESDEGRKQAFSDLIAVASIKITHTMLISCLSQTIPVTDDPYFARLLSLRTAESNYIGGVTRRAPFVGLEIAKAVIPDEALQKLSFEEIGEYRKKTIDAYQAWSVELNKISSMLGEDDALLNQDKIQKLITSEISPRLIDYRNEMKAVRDDMFARVLKSIFKWEMPTLSLAYLGGLDYTKAIALFASALAPTIPHIIDYVKELRSIKRKNSLTYLIGLSTANDD